MSPFLQIKIPECVDITRLVLKLLNSIELADKYFPRLGVYVRLFSVVQSELGTKSLFCYSLHVFVCYSYSLVILFFQF
jgi:hypothetical protein